MVTIEDVYGWLRSPDAEVGASRLTTPTTTILEKIIDSIQTDNYIQAYQMISYLEASAENLDNMVEISDIMVEIGLAYYQMGNLIMAEEYWSKAVAAYPVNSHEHAVTRWLLGSVQWLIETRNINAMNNWKGAISEFRCLADGAEMSRLMRVKNWYENRISELENSLVEQIAIKFP